MIPGLKNAKIVRHGVMHRNTYINAPKLLKNTYQLISNENIYFAGQLSGVEGYIESCSSGLLAGINVALKIKSYCQVEPSSQTLIGAIVNYITNRSHSNFQPMKSNFGICSHEPNIAKNLKKQFFAEKSSELINKLKDYLDETIFR